MATKAKKRKESRRSSKRSKSLLGRSDLSHDAASTPAASPPATAAARHPAARPSSVVAPTIGVIPAPRRMRKLTWLGLAVALALVALALRVPALTESPLDRDEGAYAFIAQQWRL